MNHQVTAADWVEAIASKSSLTAGTVQAILDSYGIEPQSTLPRRKHLRIRSVRLQGVKEGAAENGPFDSTFRFGQGLWAILSDHIVSIATRYYRCLHTFFAATCTAATVIFWL